MSKYLGDIASQQPLDFSFNTHVGGVPTTLAGTPSLKVYKGNSTVETAVGPTLTVDFDGLTGLNHVRVATTDSFYTSGADYRVYIAAGTVGGNSVVGVCVAEFSIENRNDKADVVAIDGMPTDTGELGTATAGGANTITLEAGVSFGTNALRDRVITITGGTGAGQSEIIASNTNATPSVVTVARNWLVQPDNTSRYAIGDSGQSKLAPVQSITSLSINNPAGFGLSIYGGDSAVYIEGNQSNIGSASVYIANSPLNSNPGAALALQNSAPGMAALSIVNLDAGGTGMYVEGGGKDIDANLSGTVTSLTSVANIVSGLLGGTADGVAVSTILSRLNAFAKGHVIPTDNGDGTVTLAVKGEDNTTTLFSITYRPSTGART